METFDAIVLGAGAMGSAAAYYLAKAGHKTLLLEQFQINHDKGSSHGDSRIIRYSYEEPRYVELARATYPLWFALEEESGEQLYIKTGGIDFGKASEPTLQNTLNTVRSEAIPHEVFTSAEAELRFPQFKFDDDMMVLYQPDSGMLLASLAVRTHVHMAAKYGATIQTNTPVTSITIHGDSVEVHTSGETFFAARLIVTAGSWAGRLLEQSAGLMLPLTPWRCQPAQFKPVPQATADYTSAAMPVYIFHRGGDFTDAMYGLPSHNESGVKAAYHHGKPVDHPSHVNYTPDDEEVEHIRQGIGSYIPGIAQGELVTTHICLYTMTPDEHFIVDQHPLHPHVVIGAGFSGHGFKFCTTIGQIMMQLATEGHTPHDISLFKITRFG